ncbi:MAG: TetR/AcrR family transcriptional regulator C-terminal domain-containing protein [Actinomycetota bacterium]|nr:TetR/AcrR family transcriptional regulator C-terminal domain-containing protein [Actinomycetota bacterium]
MPSPRRHTAAAGPAPRRRRSRGELERRLIVDAALALSAREEGYEGLTFQALGDELGVHPTAIYRHFRDKDELMLTLVEAIHAEVLAGLPPPGTDWAADLSLLALRSYEVFLRFPAISQVAAVRTTRSENEFQVVERIVGCLQRAGFDDADAAVYYRAFSDVLLGYVALDAGFAALRPATREGDLRAWSVNYRSLPAERFPGLAATAALIPAVADPANFTTALDLLIEAIRARAGKGGERCEAGTGPAAGR